MHITKAEALNIYKHYLGSFFDVTLTPEDIAYFRVKFPVMKDYYIFGNSVDLHKAGKYFLLNFGKQDYKHILSYDIIFTYFQEGAILEHEGAEDSRQAMEWFNTRVPTYFVYTLANTPPNKMLQPSLNYLLACRRKERKVTIYLCEQHLDDIKASFQEVHNINLKGVSKSDPTAIITASPVVEIESKPLEFPVVEGIMPDPPPAYPSKYQDNEPGMFLRSKKPFKKNWKKD
jgi:hypothetical protein